MMIRLLNRLLIPYLEEPSHYHKAVIGDLKRLTHPNLSDFYFSANLTPQVFAGFFFSEPDPAGFMPL
jgi:hypothetical protein